MASSASRKSTGGSSKAAVQVFCRIRPTNAKELTTGYTCVKYGEETIEIKTEDGENKFNFDHIFGMESTQQEVFQNIAGALIVDVLSGYNATILAYGQSGTGKVSLFSFNPTANLLKCVILLIFVSLIVFVFLVICVIALH